MIPFIFSSWVHKRLHQCPLGRVRMGRDHRVRQNPWIAERVCRVLMEGMRHLLTGRRRVEAFRESCHSYFVGLLTDGQKIKFAAEVFASWQESYTFGWWLSTKYVDRDVGALSRFRVLTFTDEWCAMYCCAEWVRSLYLESTAAVLTMI